MKTARYHGKNIDGVKRTLEVINKLAPSVFWSLKSNMATSAKNVLPLPPSLPPHLRLASLLGDAKNIASLASDENRAGHHLHTDGKLNILASK